MFKLQMRACGVYTATISHDIMSSVRVQKTKSHIVRPTIHGRVIPTDHAFHQTFRCTHYAPPGMGSSLVTHDNR